MKLTMLHDGSLKPRNKLKPPADVLAKPTVVSAKHAVPELQVVDKYANRTTGLAYDMANNMAMAPRRPMEMTLDLGTGK